MVCLGKFPDIHVISSSLDCLAQAPGGIAACAHHFPGPMTFSDFSGTEMQSYWTPCPDAKLALTELSAARGRAATCAGWRRRSAARNLSRGLGDSLPRSPEAIVPPCCSKRGPENRTFASHTVTDATCREQDRPPAARPDQSTLSPPLWRKWCWAHGWSHHRFSTSISYVHLCKGLVNYTFSELAP